MGNVIEEDEKFGRGHISGLPAIEDKAKVFIFFQRAGNR
jgi:hypothetical protein